MMKVDLAKIKSKAGQKLEFAFDQPIDTSLSGYSSFFLHNNLVAEGLVLNQGMGAQGCNEYQARISYRALLEQTCASCGKAFCRDLAGNLQVVFRESEQEDESGELVVYPTEGDQADISDAILAEIFFALPMRPLCREDCRGICSKCGADLNEKVCSCVEDNIDPRWEKLKILLPTQD